MPNSPRGASVTGLMTAGGHEEVVYVSDRESGLRAVIAIHSTALGPALGGVRFWRYASGRDAVVDALRLAEAMTLKAAVSGLAQGGGKAVVHWEDPEQARPRRLLRALGRAIDALGGRYVAAEDVGATTADMNGLAEVTPWVTGVDEDLGGSGDPSPVTALGVVHAMRAVLRAVDGDPTLRDRRVVVQGAGHVGSHLVALLVEEGSKVEVADLVESRAEALVHAFGVTRIPASAVWSTPCDVFAPCALGGVLDEDTIPALACRAVVGAANNQLGILGGDRLLAARGIVYAPDFVVSAGGIINIAEEFVGYDRTRALARAAHVGTVTAEVLEAAAADGVTPLRAAERLAWQRVRAARAARAARDGRWHPGDPAAWTNGEPLRTVRP